jgi:hypothetical protein
VKCATSGAAILATAAIGSYAAIGASGCGGAATSPTDAGAVIDAATAALCSLAHDAFNRSAKVNANSVYRWSCSATLRTLAGNGIPDHPVETGSFATPISAQSVAVSFPIEPTHTEAVTGDATNVAYAINSVKLDPTTAASCASTATGTRPGEGCVLAMGRDPWRIEALGGAFLFGVDESNAHVQPNGQYHYHGMPEGIITGLDRGQAMTLIAFARDGCPVYARYGYTSASDPQSEIKVVTASWQKVTGVKHQLPSLIVGRSPPDGRTRARLRRRALPRRARVVDWCFTPVS